MMLWMQRVGALCGSLSKQAHTQDKEEGMQEPSPHINYAKVCTSQQKKLEKLKEKLDSS